MSLRSLEPDWKITMRAPAFYSHLEDCVLPLTVPLEGGDVLYHLHLIGLVQCVPLTYHDFILIYVFSSLVKKFSWRLRTLRTPNANSDVSCRYQGRLQCLWMRLFMAVPMTPSAAASDILPMFAKEATFPCCSSSLFFIPCSNTGMVKNRCTVE